MDDIYEKLVVVFRDVFDDKNIQIYPHTTSNDIEGWDSLSHMNLMIAVELAFGIEFTQREITSFANVGELVDCIHRKMD